MKELPARAWHLDVETDSDGKRRGYPGDEVVEVISYDWPNWRARVRYRSGRGKNGASTIRIDRVWIDNLSPGSDGVDIAPAP